MQMAGVMDAVKGSSGRRGFEWKNRTLKLVHRPLALGLILTFCFCCTFHFQKISVAAAPLQPAAP